MKRKRAFARPCGRVEEQEKGQEFIEGAGWVGPPRRALWHLPSAYPSATWKGSRSPFGASLGPSAPAPEGRKSIRGKAWVRQAGTGARTETLVLHPLGCRPARLSAFGLFLALGCLCSRLAVGQELPKAPSAPTPAPATSAGEGHCKADRAGFCTDPVVTYRLSTREPTARVRVNCNLGSVLAVQLPDGESLRGKPVVGNSAIFRYALQEDPPSINLWPQMPEGAKDQSAEVLEGEISNVQLNLKSGINIILEMRISFQDGVQRVIFEFPEKVERDKNRSDLKDQVRVEVEEELKQRFEQLESEAHVMALKMNARGILDRIHCRGIRERAMKNLLVVWAHNICQIGSHVYIDMSIHNRARDLFSLQKLEVLAPESGELVPLDTVVEWEGKTERPQLSFDKKARAVVVFPVSDDTASAEYAIRVTESAGKMRVVTLEGVGF